MNARDQPTQAPQVERRHLSAEDQAIDAHDVRMLRFFFMAHLAGSAVIFGIACLVASTLASQPARHADPTGPLEVSLRRPAPASVDWQPPPVPASIARAEPPGRDAADMPPPWATGSDGRVAWRQE
ncbi:MAG: hypothetical protein RL375_1601 [Pseudomonadota bacterium]